MIHMRFAIIIIYSLLCYQSYTQDQTLYIFSNIDDQIDTGLLQKFEEDNQSQKGDKIIISIGDNDISQLELLKKKCKGCRLKFLTGDRDQDELDAFHDLADKNKIKSLTEGNTCPEPQVYRIDADHVLMSINSNWYLNRDIQYQSKNEDCKTFNKADFAEQLESVIEDHEKETIILLAHHNTYSNTWRGGKQLGRVDMVPLIGSMYASYRRHVGNSQDLTSRPYRDYIHTIHKHIHHKSLISIGGHDYINTVYGNAGLLLLNVHSGSEQSTLHHEEGLRYQSQNPSYIRIIIGDETILSYQSATTSTDIDIPSYEPQDEPIADLIKINPVPSHYVASRKYKTNRFVRWLMGSGYRKAWSTAIQAPTLDIDQRGLTPYARGGGLQTQSVKLKDGKGYKYAFRALDKEPEKSLSEELQKTIYKDIVQELITTMHPYGPLAAYELIKHTDILHIRPELYAMKTNQVELSGYRDFENKLGTLEIKPKGKSKKREGFGGADEVVSTFEMLRKLRQDDDHIIDRQAFARARVFDMYIGDWDRHEDNWKWAAYKSKKKKIYKPIPKDRDHVFSKWTGVIPKIADLVIPNAENFGMTFDNLSQLNFKARHLDRQLASEITEAEWIDAAEYISRMMTDEVIDNAVLAMPSEVHAYYNQEIVSKLKSRRNSLSRAVRAYYHMLAAHVEVIGTNKKDYFEVIRTKDAVEVNIYTSNKKGDKKNRFYHRVFDANDTHEICLYGLDAIDHFDISGEVERTIPMRIIGGDESDVIRDRSVVSSRSAITKVYDSKREDFITASDELSIRKPSRPAYYDPYAFAYDGLLPLPSIRRSSGNGWGVDLGVRYIQQGFNKPDWSKQYQMNIIYYPNIQSYRVAASYRYRHMIGLSDFFMKANFSDEYDKYPFFYGFGNDTEFDHEAREDGKYEIDYDYFRYDMGLTRSFWYKSEWNYGIFTEYHGVTPEENSEINADLIPDPSSFVGGRSSIQLDLTDREHYPTDGTRLRVDLEARMSQGGDVSSNLNAEYSWYKSIDLGIVATAALRIGYGASWGDANFYHQSQLGSNVGLRGFTRNRFVDQYAGYYNTELRFDLGSIETPLAEMNVGTFVHYDGGKVWNDQLDFGDIAWQNSFGGGVFIAPYSTEYALSYSIIYSDDERLYSKFQIGFSF